MFTGTIEQHKMQYTIEKLNKFYSFVKIIKQQPTIIKPPTIAFFLPVISIREPIRIKNGKQANYPINPSLPVT